MPQQNARLNTDMDNKLTSSYYDGTDWYNQVKAKDGAIATLGTTTDAEATGNGTLIAITKRLRTLLGGGLPAALSGSGNLKTAIAEALPAGTNNIGDVDIATTPADATPGSAHPAKAFLIAGSDGTNARSILTDANGVVQVQALKGSQEVIILSSSARTTSGDTSSSPVDTKKYREALFFLDVTAASGTNPTLDVVIKTKDPASGKWFDLVVFTQATGVTSEKKVVSSALGSQIAAFYTITGSTPSFTFSLGAVLKS